METPSPAHDGPSSDPRRTILDRRRFVKTGALGVLVFQVNGCAMPLTPGEARARGADRQTFTAAEIATLDRLGETLLPGAAEKGFAQFIDHQCAGPHSECLSMIRYFDWPPPYGDFYKSGLAALDALSVARLNASFADVEPAEATELVREISAGQPDGWSGPPAPLFYLVTRSDAVDVVYGTVEGFEQLEVAYLAHIEPETKW
ncbi:MAG: gluconate 2-dehydrogenase subunit 3 family protein [Pseudomonadota bacterium]